MKTIMHFGKNIFILFALLLSGVTSACHKAGPGGNSSVSGTVKHHSLPIPNCIVYIKYGATEFPGTDVSIYDNHVTADANAHYEFTSLYKGNYFLYGVGFDNTIMQTVTGGIGIKLKKNEKATSVPSK